MRGGSGVAPRSGPASLSRWAPASGCSSPTTVTRGRATSTAVEVSSAPSSWPLPRRCSSFARCGLFGLTRRLASACWIPSAARSSRYVHVEPVRPRFVGAPEILRYHTRGGALGFGAGLDARLTRHLSILGDLTLDLGGGAALGSTGSPSQAGGDFEVKGLFRFKGSEVQRFKGSQVQAFTER